MSIRKNSEPKNEATSESKMPLLQESSVVVGIPAYNEEVGIGSVVLGSQSYADEVVVVDDGSDDNTAEIARQTGAHVIEHEENKGKGATVRTILSYIREADNDIGALVLLDGDGQHLPEDIPDVVNPVLKRECEIAVGSRYLDQQKTETPLYRRCGQKVLDIATTGSASTHLTDTQSGFRALSPSAISRMNVRTDGMGIESEMISTAGDHNLSIKEVPIDVRYEGVDGQTHNPLRHGLSVLVFVIQLIRDRHPLVFFGVPGLLLLVTGSLLAVHTALLYQSTEAFYQWRALLSGFWILLGALSLFTGLLLNQISNMIKNFYYHQDDSRQEPNNL
ncbi:glycosyltransferase family 2 protein [Halovenus salina]|uniref:Glycosyltransferase family 2 protein n=1 Tax=Halovenus salina TaxID=1510225 RepID=A0ABD5W3L5_9EURY|nr:glycosyltransferase family 2 protein [Halovenus salina]